MLNKILLIILFISSSLLLFSQENNRSNDTIVRILPASIYDSLKRIDFNGLDCRDIQAKFGEFSHVDKLMAEDSDDELFTDYYYIFDIRTSDSLHYQALIFKGKNNIIFSQDTSESIFILYNSYSLYRSWFQDEYTTITSDSLIRQWAVFETLWNDSFIFHHLDLDDILYLCGPPDLIFKSKVEGKRETKYVYFTKFIGKRTRRKLKKEFKKNPNRDLIYVITEYFFLGYGLSMDKFGGHC